MCDASCNTFPCYFEWSLWLLTCSSGTQEGPETAGVQSQPSMPCSCVQSKTAVRHKVSDSIPVRCGGVPAVQVMFLDHEEPFSNWQLACLTRRELV